MRTQQIVINPGSVADRIREACSQGQTTGRGGQPAGATINQIVKAGNALREDVIVEFNRLRDAGLIVQKSRQRYGWK